MLSGNILNVVAGFPFKKNNATNITLSARKFSNRICSSDDPRVFGVFSVLIGGSRSFKVDLEPK